MEYAATSISSKNIKNNNKFQFNKIECLIFDKLIDSEGYSKYNENDIDNNNKRKSLKNQIKLIKKKKQFPPHLIRRFETNRKIYYFQEKNLYYVK